MKCRVGVTEVSICGYKQTLHCFWGDFEEEAEFTHKEDTCFSNYPTFFFT